MRVSTAIVAMPDVLPTDTLLSNYTPDIRAFDAIDSQPYIGADTVIAREMDDIITFASPRNSTEQLSVVRDRETDSLNHPLE